MDNRDPFIYKTADYGKTWTNISDGLPKGHPLAYVLNVAENPNRQGMLFAGTGNAFYYSMDDGATWTQFKDGLPAAPVTWIEVQPRYHDVVVSTYGRGLYVLRDITRARAAGPGGADRAGRSSSRRARDSAKRRSGSAEFLYSVKTASHDPVTFEILDAAGAVIRTLDGPGARRPEPGDVGLAPRTARAGRAADDSPGQPAHLGRGAVQGTAHAPDPALGHPAGRSGSARWRRPACTPCGCPSAGRRHEAVRGPQGPGHRSLGRRISRPPPPRAPHPRRHERVGRHDQPARGHAKADRGSAEGARRQDARRAGAARSRHEDDGRRDDALTRTEIHSDDKWYVEAYKIYMNLCG